MRTPAWRCSYNPDNRQAVDYGARSAALRAIRSLSDNMGAAACARRLLDSMPDGQIKLYLSWKTLTFRREHDPLFRDGDYLPLRVNGNRSEQVCAFARRQGSETLLVLLPRLLAGLMEERSALPVGQPVWGDNWLELPAGYAAAHWTNVLTGETVSAQTPDERQGLALAQIFESFPYALLWSNRDSK